MEHHRYALKLEGWVGLALIVLWARERVHVAPHHRQSAVLNLRRNTRLRNDVLGGQAGQDKKECACQKTSQPMAFALMRENASLAPRIQ
jgi:hypothetical protein